MTELLTAFAVLIAAPFCIGLLPALAMPGRKRHGGKRGTKKTQRRNGREAKGASPGKKRL